MISGTTLDRYPENKTKQNKIILFFPWIFEILYLMSKDVYAQVHYKFILSKSKFVTR